MMGQHPFRHDRPAATDDAANAVHGEVNISKAHTGMDGEIVDPLLALLDQRVAVDLPCQVFGHAIDLFERLIDRHRPDRHGGITDDPFAGIVNVAACGEVHNIVRAPARRPDHFVNFFLNAGGDGGVADIGVDLDEEVAANDLRL